MDRLRVSREAQDGAARPAWVPRCLQAGRELADQNSGRPPRNVVRFRETFLFKAECVAATSDCVAGDVAFPFFIRVPVADICVGVRFSNLVKCLKSAFLTQLLDLLLISREKLNLAFDAVWSEVSG